MGVWTRVVWTLQFYWIGISMTEASAEAER